MEWLRALEMLTASMLGCWKSISSKYIITNIVTGCIG